MSRLARRGFTLGELNTMTIAGNALCLEFWRLSRARVSLRLCSPRDDGRSFLAATQWNYKRGYPGIPPSFRSPTPVIVFQSVLIPGAFLSGFLLSPLLVISRHIASRPAHRLKVRTEGSWNLDRPHTYRLAVRSSSGRQRESDTGGCWPPGFSSV